MDVTPDEIVKLNGRGDMTARSGVRIVMEDWSAEHRDCARKTVEGSYSERASRLFSAFPKSKNFGRGGTFAATEMIIRWKDDYNKGWLALAAVWFVLACGIALKQGAQGPPAAIEWLLILGPPILMIGGGISYLPLTPSPTNMISFLVRREPPIALLSPR